MPLKTISSSEAYNNFNKNPFSLWHKPPKHEEKSEKIYANDRLWNNKFFTPNIRSGFQFTQESNIFTIGSCFARNLERHLLQSGLKIRSYNTDFDKYEKNPASNNLAQRNFQSKFNTFSILQQLQWSLDPEISFPLDALVKLPNDEWADPHAHISIKFSDYNSTIERRNLLNQLFSKADECSILIITLGLNEVWRDVHTGLVTNYTPPPEMLQADSSRFVFEIPSFDENIKALEDIYALISKFVSNKCQIVITVSPVALAGTFGTQDIVISNWHSKTMLLAAAVTWAHMHDDVHYFPSFEMVHHSCHENGWNPDRRHPSDAVVNNVIDCFLEHYLKE